MLRARQPRAAITVAVLVAAALVAAVPATATARRQHHAPRRHHARGYSSSAAGCTNADVPATRAAAAEMRAAVVCLMNKTRERYGLPPLGSSGKLNDAAQSWDDAMVATGNFSEGNPGARITAAGFNWSTVGENIATGYNTPQGVLAAWMRSQPHCYNILNPAYTRVGTGVNRRPVSGFGNRAATWTQDFGLPMGQRSHSGNWGPASHCPY